MKKTVFALAMSGTLLFSSCIGSFTAFNNLKDWNLEVTENKFVNELIFIALNIVPVYGAFLFADGVIFNTIEFWTGNNPLGMKEGEQKIKIAEKNGKKYQITTSLNKVNIVVLEGENQGNSVDLEYDTTQKAWFMDKDGEKIKLADHKDGMNYVYLPNGEAKAIQAGDVAQAIAETRAVAEDFQGVKKVALVK